MSRARDISNDQANVGGSIAPYVAGKNAVINGGFDIWQRGTSFSQAASTRAYTADRWLANTDTNEASTISRQTTGDTTNLPNIQYCARFQRNSGQTGTNDAGLFQSLETTNSIPLVGKTITLSFYARAGANFSGTNLITSIYCGSGTDQNVFSYTGFTVSGTTNLTLTTTWTKYTLTVNMTALATEIGIGIFYKPTGTAGANDYFEITGVQLEIGSIATPFSRAGGSIGGELALCQRYYYRQTANGVYTPFSYPLGASSTTIADSVIVLPVQMRTAPTILETSNIMASDQVTAYSSGTWTLISITYSVNLAQIRYTHGSAALTQYRSYMATANNNSSAYIGLSAEL